MPLVEREEKVYREEFVDAAGGATSVTMSAVITLLRKMGFTEKKFSDETLQGWFKPGPDNMLDEDGFIAGVDANPDSKELLRARAMWAFHGSDTNMDKVLSETELRAFFDEDSKTEMSDGVFDMVMNHTDLNGDNKITLREFFKCVGVKD